MFTLDGDDLVSDQIRDGKENMVKAREALRIEEVEKMSLQELQAMISKGLDLFIRQSVQAAKCRTEFHSTRSIMTLAQQYMSPSQIQQSQVRDRGAYYEEAEELEALVCASQQLEQAVDVVAHDIRTMVQDFIAEKLDDRTLYSVMLTAEPDPDVYCVKYTVKYLVCSPPKFAHIGADLKPWNFGIDTGPGKDRLGLTIVKDGEVLGGFYVNSKGQLNFAGDIDTSAKHFAAKVWMEYEKLRLDK